jgi:hypothetical protein
MWICDRMGWTRLYWISDTYEIPGHHERHGRKCSGSPNCNNPFCISEGVPRWFRRLTFWDY